MTGGQSIRKLRPPGLASWVIARPRIDQLLREQFDHVDVVELAASPGAGKTVAAQLFSLRFAWPTAWVNIDSADRSPARLLGYVARAMQPFVGRDSPSVEEILRSGAAPAEAAVALAEQVTADDLLLVFDNCEEIHRHAEASAMLSALLAYLPPSSRAVLLSREPLDQVVSSLEGRVARVGDRELALDVEEAELLLRAAGRPPDRARDLVASTGGWAAGIIFDTQVSAERSSGDLAGYLNHEILEQLDEEEQAFLLRTSLLDKVTAASASTVLADDDPTILDRLVRHRLPATVEADGGIVYHPFFRQFLRSQLQERLPDVARELRRSRAATLTGRGDHAEAMSLLFENDDLDEAAAVAEDALPALLTTADWTSLLAWLEVLGEQRVESRPPLLAAKVRCLTRTRQFLAAQKVVRDLDRRGLLRDAVAGEADLVADIGWAFLSHPAEGLQLMAPHVLNDRAQAIHYTLEVIGGTGPVDPPTVGDDSDGWVIGSWGLLLQGRFDRLLQLHPPVDALPPSHRSVPALLTMVWSGHYDLARSILDQLPHDDQGLLDYIEALVLLADGDADAALRAAQEAVGRSQRTRFGWTPFLQLTVALALIRTGQLADARGVLNDARERAAAAGELAYVEWADVYLGLAQLASGANGAAVHLLRESVEQLGRSGRRLLLPAALVYLAEAEACGGAATRAEHAVALAVQTAAELGAPSLVAQALADAPTIAAQLGATAPDHESGSSPDSPAATSLRRIEVHPFGRRPDLWVDGAPCGVRRMKVIELAAYLAAHDGAVSRQQIQLDLFPEHDQRTGSNYFRQITHQFRRATGIPLARWDADTVGLPPGCTIWSSDVALERAMATQAQRDEALVDILDVLDQIDGSYLQSSTLPWVERRRFELDVLRRHAGRAAAPLAHRHGRPDVAERLAERALADDSPSDELLVLLLDLAASTADADHAELLTKRVHAALADRGDDPDPWIAEARARRA